MEISNTVASVPFVTLMLNAVYVAPGLFSWKCAVELDIANANCDFWHLGKREKEVVWVCETSMLAN